MRLLQTTVEIGACEECDHCTRQLECAHPYVTERLGWPKYVGEHADIIPWWCPLPMVQSDGPS